MNILITGITGFVASHLGKFLVSKNITGLTLYGTKRWRSPEENIRTIIDKINFVDMELKNFLSVKKAIKESRPTIIFHLAAQSFIPAGISGPLNTFETNTIGTLNILEAVRLNGTDPKIHIASTAEVYGKVDKEGVLLDETVFPRPSNLYAVSKLAAEMLGIQYYETYGLKTIISRMLPHTGPGRGVNFAESSFARQIAEIEAGLRKPVIYVGNLSAVRTFLDVRDAVEAYWLLVNKCKPGECYNICGNTTLSIKEVMDKLISFSNFPDKIEVKVDEKRFRPNDSFRPGVNIAKFVKATGWKPKIPFDKTLKDLLDYWRKKVLKDGE